MKLNKNHEGNMDACLRTLRINPSAVTQKQIDNGFVFGMAFEKLNLSKGRKFKNSDDIACKFQNFKNTKDLMYQNFKIEIPANNIIYRAQEILIQMAQAVQVYEEHRKTKTLQQLKSKYKNQATQGLQISEPNKKLLTLKQKTILSKRNNSATMPQHFNVTSYLGTQYKMPGKILQIEKKLQKYRQEKVKHQLFSLEQRKKEIAEYERLIQEHRQFELSKTRMHNQMVKEMEKKVYDVWAKTQDVRKARQDKEMQFFRFMKSKRDKNMNQLRDQETKSFKNGLEQFELNCVRQGVELQHDPNKEYVEKADNFNKVIMMERIHDHIANLERQKKERCKRQNIKLLETQNAKIKSEKEWEEIYLLKSLEEKMSKHFESCEKIKRAFLQQQALQQERKIASDIFKKKQRAVPLKQATQEEKEQFQQDLIRNRLVFYDSEIQRLKARNKRRQLIAEQVIQALISTVIQAEESNTSEGFTYFEWKSLEKAFLDFKSSTLTDKQNCSANSLMLDSSQMSLFEAYHEMKGEFSKSIFLQSENQEALKQTDQLEVGQFLEALADAVYPAASLPQKPENMPLYMPLRIAVCGNRLTGKSTQVKKIADKFGLALIDPNKILSEAIESVAKSVSAVDDGKKKKDSKKQGDQQTPQKMALKSFGQSLIKELLESQNPNQNIEIDQETLGRKAIELKLDELPFMFQVKAIKFKLKTSFSAYSSFQQASKIYKSRKNEEQNKYKEALEDYQNKKNQPEDKKKKENKKAPEPLQEPVFNQFFFTDGFVLDNISLDAERLRIIQKELNGFVAEDERINLQAQRLKSELGCFFPVKTFTPSDTLKKGFFNVLIEIEAEDETIKERKESRKKDPVTGQIYHPVFNPAPTDVKGLNQRLEAKQIEEIPSQGKYQPQKLSRMQYYSRNFGFQGGDGQKQSAYVLVKTSNEELVAKEEGEEKVKKNTSESLWRQIEQAIKKRLKLEYTDYEHKISVQKQQKEQHNQNGQRQGQNETLSGNHKIQNEIKPQDTQEPQRKESQKRQQIFEDSKAKEEKQETGATIQILTLKDLIKKSQGVAHQILIDLLQKGLLQNSLLKNYQVPLAAKLEQFILGLRSHFNTSLIHNKQKDFLEMLQRPDDKTMKILHFQENYNKLVEQLAGGGIRSSSNMSMSSFQNSLKTRKIPLLKSSDKQAISHLLEKVDELYQDLWSNIEQKKNQAISFRQQLIESEFLEQTSQQVVELLKQILQKELNLTVDVLAVVLESAMKLEGKTGEPVIDYLCLGLPKNATEKDYQCSLMGKLNSEIKIPRLEYYLKQVNECLKLLPTWFQKKQKQSAVFLQHCNPYLNELALTFIRKKTVQIQLYIKLLKVKCYSLIIEQKDYFQALINKMDDWIIKRIQTENSFVYTIIKEIKACITGPEGLSKCNVKQLFATNNLSQNIKGLFGLSPIPQLFPLTEDLPEVNKQFNFASNFDPYSFKVFLEQVKNLTFEDKDQLDGTFSIKLLYSDFSEYFKRRQKQAVKSPQQKLHQMYLKLDFDTLQQYLVSENRINFKELTLAILLWNFRILDQDNIQAYVNMFVQKKKVQVNSVEILYQEFDLLQCLLPANHGLTRLQYHSINTFLFDILTFRPIHFQKSGDLIATRKIGVKLSELAQLLRTFNLLQTYKFGDTLMMLNQQKS